MAVHGIKEIFPTIDPLPAQEHLSTAVKIVGLSADLLETGEHNAVSVE